MYYAKILADSIGPADRRLTTWELCYPRMVHAELLTHRTLSKNSASSRAIPAKKMRERIVGDPAVPVFWGKNQSGMRADEELSSDRTKCRACNGSGEVKQFTVGGGKARYTHCDVCIGVGYILSPKELAKDWWQRGLNAMVKHHEEGEYLGIHKQIVNRVLEPWMYIAVILTGTEFENFFALRAHPDAQPEIRHLAELMLEAYRAGKPRILAAGEWHRPLIDFDDVSKGHSEFDLNKIAVGRCARVSYLTHDGKLDPAADIALYDRLSSSKPGHWSPFEHVAQAMTRDQWNAMVLRESAAAAMQGKLFDPSVMGNLVGWKQLRKFFADENWNGR